MDTSRQYIHAEKNEDGTFEPYELSPILSEITDGYEYGDVEEGSYQIWEFPSGKIFDIKPDRKVSNKDYYATPSGLLWMPELVYVKTDQTLVNKAYEELKNTPEPPSFFKLIFKRR